MDRGAKKFATLLQQEALKLPENTPKYRKQRGSFLPEKGKEKNLGTIVIPRFSLGGDCWTRTSDLLRVKQAL
jgi:hypothetical protein